MAVPESLFLSTLLLSCLLLSGEQGRGQGESLLATWIPGNEEDPVFVVIVMVYVEWKYFSTVPKAGVVADREMLW